MTTDVTQPQPAIQPEPLRELVLVPAGVSAAPSPEVNLRRVSLQLTAAVAVVMAVVGIVGLLISRRVAEQQSIHDAAQLTDVIAASVVQPALTDQMASSSAAAAALGPIVRAGVLNDSLIRVKVWSPDGRILYSDDQRLIGRTFPLDDEAQVSLSTPRTQADVTDLARPENEFERDQGKLLEVYRPVWTPNGSPLLFEAYYRYDTVTARSHDLWRGFAGVMLSSLAAVFVLLIPLLWALTTRVRQFRTERERMMRQTVQASDDERRRIAATLHDGVVQPVAAAAFSVAAEAERAAAGGDERRADRLRASAATVRAGVTSLRSLLVDIYPQSLAAGGLAAALDDLVTSLSADGAPIISAVDRAEADALSEPQQQAVFRLAQEALRNAVKHAGASEIALSLAAVGDDVVLTVADDGAGLDLAAAPVGSSAEPGHLGLSLMSDVARGCGAELTLLRPTAGGLVVRMRLPGAAL